MRFKTPASLFNGEHPQHRFVFSGEDHVHPDCLQRGYVFGGSFLLSLSEVKKTKIYAVNDCNAIEFF
jgi:hypothetical protein